MARKQNTVKTINQNNQHQKLKQETIKYSQPKNPQKTPNKKLESELMYSYESIKESLEKVLRSGLGSAAAL